MSDESNRFQTDFSKSCERFTDVISLDRLKDPMSGFKSDANICDYIVYRFPCQFYFELKSYKGGRINFSALTDTQYNGLLKKSTTLGVCAGVLFNFRLEHNDGEPEEDELCFWVDIRDIQRMKSENIKSITIYDVKDIGIQLFGQKRRVHWDYDIPPLLEKIQRAVMGAIL